MLSKKHQLRAELRGHLVQVLEERGMASSLSPHSTTPSKRSKQKEEYARALRIQMEEARRKEGESTSGNNRTWHDDVSEPRWFERRQTSPSLRLPTPEQHKVMLLEQMEEARRRREAEARKQAEEDAKWEQFAMSSSETSPVMLRGAANDDWHALLQQKRQAIYDIERELTSLSRHLEMLRVEEARIASRLSPQRLTASVAQIESTQVQYPEPNFISSPGASRIRDHEQLRQPPILPPLETQPVSTINRQAPSTSSSAASRTKAFAPAPEDEVVIVPVSIQEESHSLQSSRKAQTMEEEEEEEELQRLPVIQRYFAYIAKPRVLLSPETPSPPDTPSVPEEEHEEERSVFEDPTAQRPLHIEVSDNSDDDDEEEDEEFQKRAARTALRRAEVSSSDTGTDLKERRDDMYNNFGLTTPEQRGTPHSKVSTTSFDI